MPSPAPDVNWSLRRSHCAYWLTGAFGFSLAYAIVRYNVFKGVGWEHLPLYIVNKAVSLSAVILLAASYLLGKWIRVFDDDPMKRLVLAKFLGLSGFSLAALHVVMSMMLLTPDYYAKFFGEGKMNLTGELTMLFGALSLMFLASPAVSSLPRMRQDLGQRWWRRSQRLGYLALTLNSGHLFVMGYKGWIDTSTWPGGMPPITMIAFVIGILPMIAWLTTRR
jgi:DMSO/TMAO reductase YedYZ heme-binding membrane subunit